MTFMYICRNGTDFNTLISQSNFCIFHNTTQSVIIVLWQTETEGPLKMKIITFGHDTPLDYKEHFVQSLIEIYPQAVV